LFGWYVRLLTWALRFSTPLTRGTGTASSLIWQPTARPTKQPFQSTRTG